MSEELDRLDRLSAEKIMGWKLYGKTGWYWKGSGLGAARAEYRDDWQPSRNIAQAWELLEKNYCYQVFRYGDKTCEVYVWPDPSSKGPFSGEGKFVSEAATRACLKAVGAIDG